MAVDRTRTLRGALAGAAAAAVWAAQQPLDQRVFGFDYDDVELLGALRDRAAGRRTRSGWRMHLANGALFGAAYANVRRALPVPAVAARAARRPRRAPRDLAGTAALSRVHPPPTSCRRCGAPAARSRRRTWRHLLFGTVLGELERRLNPPESEPQPIDPAAAASNGHGSAEHVVSTQLTAPRGCCITGRHGLRRRATSSPPARPRATRSSPRRPSAGADLRDPDGGARAGRRRRGPTSSTTSPRARTSGSRGRTRSATIADNVAMTAAVLEAVRLEAPGGRWSWSSARARSTGRPERVPTAEDAPLRPQNPYAVSKASVEPARRLLRRRPRAARGPRARVQPRRPGPGADLRDRRTSRGRSRPGSTRARIRSGSSPAARTPAATSPTCATSCAPTGCSPTRGEPGVFNVCSGVSRSARELIAALGEVAGVPSTTRSTPPRCARTRSPRSAARPPACTPPPAGRPRSRSSSTAGATPRAAMRA